MCGAVDFASPGYPRFAVSRSLKKPFINKERFEILLKDIIYIRENKARGLFL
jgi:hypothetical protein